MEVTETFGRKNSKGGDDMKKGSPDRTAGGRRKLLSPMRRFASSGHAGAFRLVSPIDSDQELNDLEVASVLAEGNKESPDCVSPSKSKRHETPFRPTTVMTNLQRGNVQTTTPLILKNLTIHQMAAQGELVLLQQEILEGADINKPDSAGMTALLWASANGQQATTEFLVEKGADVNVSGKHGENALLLASAGGYTDIVYYLLSLGLDVNYSDESGSTGLMYACYRNHTGCIQALLEYGADITHTNEDQLTSMDLAVGQGHKAAQQTIEQHMLSLFGNLNRFLPDKL
ncbi:DNA-binding protein RFXANK-like [Mizuhopecten yessoensis]|uniref:Ankyrin repeat family A protein 2 n=1 Tax=Mizuhopecten yessoensis TaxID=6573 RepID=A0A210QZK9_MIZYE|nr:DNA-binding protein RFXANK-like [Mizuhopecten yessoensis]OWF54095.1 Ankyrin repeat family A protein 2 [Mizuhopecten yessoensis]